MGEQGVVMLVNVDVAQYNVHVVTNASTATAKQHASSSRVSRALSLHFTVTQNPTLTGGRSALHLHHLAHHQPKALHR